MSAIKLGPAHMWVSFQATEMLREYARNRWIKHARAAAMLALTSIQSEGKLVSELAKTVKSGHDKMAAIKGEVTKLKDGYKELNKENPSLK